MSGQLHLAETRRDSRADQRQGQCCNGRIVIDGPNTCPGGFWEEPILQTGPASLLVKRSNTDQICNLTCEACNVSNREDFQGAWIGEGTAQF